MLEVGWDLEDLREIMGHEVTTEGVSLSGVVYMRVSRWKAVSDRWLLMLQTRASGTEARRRPPVLLD